jgi:uncharacterized alkaline shock family protein YloU
VSDSTTQSLGTEEPTGTLPEPASGALSSSKGETIILPRVVERIAARAASEVDGVTAAQSGVGRILSRPRGSEPQASADIQAHRATVELSLAVRYPDPVRQVAEQVRERVVARVHELTGLGVGELNITVPELVADQGGRPPRVV